MSWRSQLEDRFTVSCVHCGAEIVDPARKPGQRYIRHKPCPQCGKHHPRDNQENDSG